MNSLLVLQKLVELLHFGFQSNAIAIAGLRTNWMNTGF
jgi:hypothetical protein